MARHLPAHLSYKCALALIPPATIIAPIETVRRVHDRHFARWPPHINLLYPYLSSPSDQPAQGEGASPLLKQEIHTRIQKAVKHIRAFHVSLSADPPGIFSHSKTSKTVWLDPTGGQVQELQAALQAEFIECNADSRLFVPHLSVGQAKSETAADGLAAEIMKEVREHLGQLEQEASIALDWYVNKVFVIERKGYKDRFKIIGSVQLGE